VTEDKSYSPECLPYKTRPTLPYPGICRAKVFIPPDLVQCLADHPNSCPNTISYGGSYFCFHPDKLEIAKITEAEKNKIQGTSSAGPALPSQQPANFTASAGVLPGNVDTLWDAHQDCSFIVQMCADPMNDANWRQVGVTTHSILTVTGLMSGTKYWFRVCALLGDEQSPWSDPALCMAP